MGTVFFTRWIFILLKGEENALKKKKDVMKLTMYDRSIIMYSEW